MGRLIKCSVFTASVCAPHKKLRMLLKYTIELFSPYFNTNSYAMR